MVCARVSRSVVLVFFLATAAAAQSVTPNYADPRGGEVIHIQTTGPTCLSCGPTQINFGGVASPKVTSLGLGEYDAVAPPHKEGAVAIDIFLGPFPAAHIEGRFGYAVQREPVLIPISAAGVVGREALWSTELWVHNDSDRDVSMLPILCIDLIGVHDCQGDPLIVKANSSRKLPARSYASPEYIGGFLFPPADASDKLSYDLRLLDAAHAGNGTSLPVVHYSAMQRRKLTMLNVPADNVRARRRLRIETAGDSDFVVRVYDLDSGRELAERTWEARLPTDSAGLVFTINDDVLNGTAAGATRLRVEVEETWPPAPSLASFYAFISTTDNVTQQVTIIAPQ